MEKILHVSFSYTNPSDETYRKSRCLTESDVQSLLNEGWKVKMAVPFSQHVSVSNGTMCVEAKLRGDYGITYVLEK